MIDENYPPKNNRQFESPRRDKHCLDIINIEKYDRISRDRQSTCPICTTEAFKTHCTAATTSRTLPSNSPKVHLQVVELK